MALPAPTKEDLTEIKRYLTAMIDVIVEESSPRLDPVRRFLWQNGGSALKAQISDATNEAVLGRIAERGLELIMKSPYMRKRLDELLNGGHGKPK